MALIAVSIAVHPGNANHSGTAPGYIAFGSILAAIFSFMIVGQLASRLVVTQQGLAWRYYLQSRSIAWADIQDVLVLPANALGRYYSPGIETGGRLIRINSVIGPRRYTETIVSAIRAAHIQAEVVAAFTARPDLKPTAPTTP
jgi:hypothetical protein